ncbi:hypothetical protein BD414DRAFT_540824 [Trametes punicea]|nr:hypothetical protein BD414DRAFT_540824 [Trametes punicea]
MEVPFPEPLGTLLIHETAARVMTLVGFTALLCDHLVTFTDEVNLIWNARKGVVLTIFLLNRYCIPVVLALDIYESFGNAAASVTFCKIWTVVQSYVTIASYISIHAIVAWRIYVLLNGKAWVAQLLWIAGFLNCATTTGITTASLIPIISHLQPYHHACVGNVPSYIWAIWLPSIVFETLLFGLTIKALLYQGQRHSLTSLSLLLYRDGMLYFVAVTCETWSLTIWSQGRTCSASLASTFFALAMVNIAGSRLILNLKAFAASAHPDEDLTWDESAPVHTLRRPRNHHRSPVDIRFADDDLRSGDEESLAGNDTSMFDLELYAIERECQQLGDRLR